MFPSICSKTELNFSKFVLDYQIQMLSYEFAGKPWSISDQKSLMKHHRDRIECDDHLDGDSKDMVIQVKSINLLKLW